MDTHGRIFCSKDPADNRLPGLIIYFSTFR